MLLVPSMEWILYQRKTVAIHWQADANGKKTLFQAYPSNFCLDLLLWRCFLMSFCILARFREPHWQVGRLRLRLQWGLAPLAAGRCSRRFLPRHVASRMRRRWIATANASQIGRAP